MSGFRKAKGQQAALKLGLYGPPGSGKTFTALLIAEGLARHSGKRIAFVDTEHGTDFYSQPVPARQVHPDAFDFDALYTRSLTEILAEVRQLAPADYGVLVIDSMTHVWEAAMAAYRGPRSKQGGIPLSAWSKIKQPYKALLAHVLSSPMHVLLCGRQAVEYGENSEGELKAIGLKMKAEGETAYEPHILVRMEAVKTQGNNVGTITALVEKDRTGVLAGKAIAHPGFDALAQPLLSLLGDTQAEVLTEEETSVQDAEALATAEQQRATSSRQVLQRYRARLRLAGSSADVEAIGKEITPQLKKQMLPADVQVLREAYLAAHGRKAAPGNGQCG